MIFEQRGIFRWISIRMSMKSRHRSKWKKVKQNETCISSRIIILGYWFHTDIVRLWFENFFGVITYICACLCMYLNICYNIPFNLTSYIYRFLLNKVVVQNMCVVSSLWIKKYLKDDNIEMCNKEEMRGWKSCPEFDRVANFFSFRLYQNF